MQHINFVTNICKFVTLDGRALQGDFTLQVNCACVICVSQVDNSDTVLQERSVQSQNSMMFCNSKKSQNKFTVAIMSHLEAII